LSKSKAKFLIPAVGAAVVVAGGVAAYFYFKGPLGESSSPLASAKLVPNEAVMATSLSPDNLSKLEQFGTPEAQNIIGKGIQDFNQKMIGESDIDYEKDLKPWVGNVMIAFLPSTLVNSAPGTPQSVQEPNTLLVVGIKDKVSALNFVNKLKAEKGIKSQESDYQGEKIAEFITDRGTKSYSTVLNDHLVLAFDRKAVAEAIDTFKGKPSFASKEGLDNPLSKGVEVQNPLAQIYIPDSNIAVQQLISNNPNMSQLPPQTLASLKQVKSMAAGIGVDDAGIRVKVIAKLDPQAIKAQYQPAPGAVEAQLPVGTFALVTGQGISRSWLALVERSKTEPELKQAIDRVRQQLQTVNIDLDKDIFSWMNGEFASAMVPTNQGKLAPLGFGGTLIMHTSDRRTAENTLKKLDTLAQSHSITVGETNIQGKAVTEWQTPSQGVLLGHGWLNQDSVFVAVGDQVTSAIATAPNPSLNNSDTFKAVTGSLPKPNGGYFYVDMDKTVSLVTHNLLQPQNIAIPPETSAFLNSIRGLGATVTSPDNSTSQVELLLALKPKTTK